MGDVGRRREKSAGNRSASDCCGIFARRFILPIVTIALINPASAQRISSLGQTVLHTSGPAISNAHSTIGLPQNNGAFWDGTRYWFFYCEGAELRAKFGPALDALRDTPTHPSGGNIKGLTNLAKSYSVVFGKHEDTWRAWALVNRGGAPFAVYRWDLSHAGLAAGISLSPSVSAKPSPTHVSLMPGYKSFDVKDLFGTVNQGGSSSANRQFNADLSSSIGLGAITFGKSNPQDKFAFGEAEWIFSLRDGYIYNAINVGDYQDPRLDNDVRRDGIFGNFSEWKRSRIDGTSSWKSEQELEGEPPNQLPGDWSDSNYGRDTSHGGQTDFVQLADGTIYNAYVDNSDIVNGNFGHIVLKRRGASLAEGWSTVTTNAVPDNGKAWHISLTSDGTRVFLLYVKNSSDISGGNVRAGEISLRVFNPVVGAFSAEQKAISIPADSRFERMTTQWRFSDGRLPLLWSETADGVTFLAMATALAVTPVPQPTFEVKKFTEESVQLVIKGLIPGESYLVESTPNLKTWVRSAPFVATSSESIFTAPPGSGESEKFYRIVF